MAIITIKAMATGAASVALNCLLGRLSSGCYTNGMRDGDGLGTMNVGRSIVGSVGPINGADGREVSNFVPTIHELKQLAMYWIEERIMHDFDWFAYQCTGSSEWRWSIYIDRRLSRLSELLGEEVMNKVWEDAIASYRRKYPKITDEDWRVFTKGTEEEQEAWRERLQDCMFSKDVQDGRFEVEEA